VIRFEGVSFAYPNATRATLRDVDLTIPEGELCLVVGRTGSGKSTLLRAINGLVPHFSGGTLSGTVTVDGRDTRHHPPRDLADVVGYVGQDPDAGFVTDTVEDELAYAMENLGLAPATMRRRVEDVLDLLGLADLRGRALPSLSAGQQQRVAVGSVLTAHPRVLVLDEPTSALDPPAAEEVLAALQRLVHDLGLTVVLAEHRLERVVQYADRVVLIDGESLVDGTPGEVLATAPVAPPVVKLGRLAGWEPLPLSVRDARRRASALDLPEEPARTEPKTGDVVASTDRLSARYGDLVALREVTIDLRAGEVVALMGRNGAGKTTLLAHLVGLRKPTGGHVTVNGTSPYGRSGRDLAKVVGLVPQDPGRLLYAETVADECRAADKEAGLDSGTTARVLDRLAPWVPMDRHPSDLSEGERLAVALAVVLGGEPPLVLLDEPTRGLDYAAKTRLVPLLRDLASRGHAVLLSTHDVELAADLTDRTVVMAEGEIVADGPTRDVLRQSPAFAPQVNKVLGGGWLTVAEVEEALV
jgi:energy-coupling factor transport system ATP-binding protein